MDFEQARQRFDEGLRLLGADKPDEAVVCFAEVARALPDNVKAQYRLGLTQLQLGRAQQAVDSLKAAVALQPAGAAPYQALGRALVAAGRRDEARRMLGEAFQAFADRNRNEDALALCRTMVRTAPDLPNPHVSVAGMLLRMRRPTEAIEALSAALRLAPNFGPAHANLGLAKTMLGDLEAALAHFDAALRLMPPDAPETATIQTNRGTVLLNLGRFQDGWAAYEHRRTQNTSALRAAPPGARWDGETDISGKTLLVHAEQGLGDTLQFVRFLPWLQQAGARVLLAPQKALVPLLRQAAPEVEIIPPETPPQSLTYDYHCRLLSLAGFFGVDADHPPPAPPYLAAEPARSAKWREQLGDHGFRIGLCWQGSAFSVHTGRALALRTLAPLARLPGVRLISLQVGPGAAETDDLPPGMVVETPGKDFDADGAFLDTAAVMEHCDLIVSVDTSIVHLAGALGRPTWILLPTDHCWRWMGERADTPWYPQSRLFRQAQKDQWEPVIEAVRAALAEALQPR